jgi:SAM-dependent methyltransferase
MLGDVTVPFDYDARPERYRLGMRVAGEYSAGSLYEWVARLLVTPEVQIVLDVGCADGVLRRALSPSGPRLIGLDVSATLLSAHPSPVVCADATHLPFTDGVFDAVTAVNVLYHLREPVPALREVRRVLRPGGQLLAATISRHDSPEMAPYWRRPTTTFDAEDGPELLAQVFHEVTVHRWDAPLVTLPSADAVRDYLVGRQAPRAVAEAAARALPAPLRVTKRGALFVAR